VSRDDGSKFPTDLWEIFHKICVPKRKKIFVLGFGQNAVKKTGPAPSTLDWQTWLPNEIPVKSFYQILHCIVHKTGGSRESYCRICPESYAYGVPFICEDDFAFPDLVINGITGYRCSTSDEMSYRASELAFDETKRKNMIIAARKYLENDMAAPDKCWNAWKQIVH
jgi:glycosyltransferase involved in cell wall biosynthesis